MVKHLQTWLSIRKLLDIAIAGGLPISVYFWFDVRQILYAIIATTITVLLIIGDILVIKHINSLRMQIKTTTTEHTGHQDEPGSWQCSCGRYNTAYRSVCLSCGKTRPGININ